MRKQADSIFSSLPAQIDQELFSTLAQGRNVKIERIVSFGQTSPEHGWYDQDDNEWVMVLRGQAEIEFENGPSVRMKAGDHISIPAHSRHRVSWTIASEPTIWLAVHYN